MATINGLVQFGAGRQSGCYGNRPAWIAGSFPQLNVLSDKAAPATVALFDVMGRCLATRQTQLSAGT